MRTPNSKCIICGKQMYRRPFELKKVRYVSCYEHREQCKKMFQITDSQKDALQLGRSKGTNHLKGIPKSKKSNIKRSESNKKWCIENKEKVIDRGVKTRGENHYKWKGGISRLNLLIRTMTENRKWINSVKSRDGMCTKCGSIDELESHHLIGLAQIIELFGIKNRTDARNCTALWDIENGITLCIKCHCKEHNRIYVQKLKGRRNAENRTNPI